MSKVGERLLRSARQASAIARGEAVPARLFVPPEIDVKAIRLHLGLSQDDFVSEFGFTIDQIKAWEQGRSRPLGGARAYLMLIDKRPQAVRRIFAEVREDSNKYAAVDNETPKICAM